VIATSRDLPCINFDTGLISLIGEEPPKLHAGIHGELTDDTTPSPLSFA
jgi:hypothetical protein